MLPGTAQHALGLGAYGDDAFLVAVVTDGDHRRLVENDTAIAHINKGIGSARSIDRSLENMPRSFLNMGKGPWGKRGEKSAANSNNGANLGQGTSPPA